MVAALDIARYLLHLNNQEPEPELITHFRLQKLLYYCQGWWLAMRDEPLFPERIEAWAHGPVVPAVYPLFADYGQQAIAPHEGCDANISDRNMKSFVQSIWRDYGKYSASELRRMTHSEPPWKTARGDRGPDEPSSVEIDRELMRSYFAAEYEKTALPGLDLATLRKIRADVDAGRTTPFEKVKEMLLGVGQA